MGGSWGAPVPQEAWPQIALLHFKPFWASPGGPGGLWGALGPPLGPLGASFGAPRGVWGCLWCGFGGDRAGTLINRRLGVLCLSFFDLFGGVLLMFFRCFLGASPALFVVLVSASFCVDVPLVVACISRVAKMADTRCVP